MSQKPSRELIVGYGEMGHAMEHLLSGKHRLVIHDNRPVENLPSINVEQEAALADFVLFCVPASPHSDLLARGETQNISGEGIHMLRMVEKYRLFDTVRYTLYEFVHNTVKEPTDVLQKSHNYLDHVQK
jgi:hypothetical protein